MKSAIVGRAEPPRPSATRAISYLKTTGNFISVCDLLQQVKRSLPAAGYARLARGSVRTFVDRWFEDVRVGTPAARDLLAKAFGGKWVDLKVRENENGSLERTNGKVVARGLFYDANCLNEVWPGHDDLPAYFDVLEGG